MDVTLIYLILLYNVWHVKHGMLFYRLVGGLKVGCIKNTFNLSAKSVNLMNGMYVEKFTINSET